MDARIRPLFANPVTIVKCVVTVVLIYAHKMAEVIIYVHKRSESIMHIKEVGLLRTKGWDLATHVS